MRKGSITAMAAAGIFGASLVFAAGTPLAETDKPKYGGTLEVGTVYVTLTALSWDAQDFNWKHNHDTGQFYEQLFAADLSKSVKNGGPHPFYADAWLPSDAIRGELAESWEWKDNPLRVEIKLRKGIMFPEKPGVMASRELVADDVVFSYNRLANSPRKLKDYFNHVAKVEATDKHTVVFTFNGYFAEWDYRFGYGYYSGIYPKEVADAGATNWKNVNGTGPFMLTDFVQGNSNTYTKNPIYWDKDKINGGEYKLPFVDKLVYRTIKDEATFITALRTAKLDILETIRWQNVEELKKNAPQLKWSQVAQHVGHVPGVPGRHQAVRRRARASRAQHGGQQEGDRQRLLQRQCRAVRLSDASRLQGLLRAARGDAGERQGAVRVQPRQGQEAAGRGRRPQRLQLQGAGMRLQSRPHGPVAAGCRLSREGRREDRDPAHGVRRVPVGDDVAQDDGRLLHEQRPHQPDHHHPQELHDGSAVEPVGLVRSRLRQEDGRRCTPSATRASARPCSRR